MKKNNMMRIASVLLVAVLLTSCVIAGTFAKYTTTAGSSDWARVAYWGFQNENSMDITGLFASSYKTGANNDVESVNTDNVIAPGTTGTTTFAFAWDETVKAPKADGTAAAALAVTGPEVAYNFTVDTEGSYIDDSIKANTNIQWKLDDGSFGTWDALMAAIEGLSGDASGSKNYAPNTLPAEFTATDDIHTITWQWVFETADDSDPDNGSEMDAQDTIDTALGNADVPTIDELNDVKIVINITATQIDSYTAG